MPTGPAPRGARWRAHHAAITAVARYGSRPCTTICAAVIAGGGGLPAIATPDERAGAEGAEQRALAAGREREIVEQIRHGQLVEWVILGETIDRCCAHGVVGEHDAAQMRGGPRGGEI